MRHRAVVLGRGLSCMGHGTTTRFIPSNTTWTQCPRQLSTTRTVPTSPRRSRKLPLLIVGLALGGTVVYCISVPSSKATLLNRETFVPYTITSREAVSPSSFILAVSPHHPDPAPSYLVPGTSTWRHPLWSVEFKQPEVQIARHYTPLPPRTGEDAADGSLRFYVRAIGGGEMSTYLSRLRVGHDVWLRGPHVGFDAVRRLGQSKKVVFLAGGTGVVPGMQVVKAVLDESDDARVSLLWAVRRRDELQAGAGPVPKPWWDVWSSKRAVEVHVDLEAPSPVARQLIEMKAKYGERLSIQVAIDEEQTQFRETQLQKAINIPSAAPKGAVSDHGCRLHDPAMLEKAPEFEPPEANGCQCASGDGAAPGKNLFIVSGPDGFIAHYAGPKEWVGGQQIQGPVRGIAAQLQRKHQRLAHEWLVLKL